MDHKYELPVVEVKVTLPPWQNVVAPPAVIVAVGKAFTEITVAVDVFLHPFTSVTCTV